MCVGGREVCVGERCVCVCEVKCVRERYVREDEEPR